MPKIVELQHRKIYNYNDRRYFIGGTVEEFDIPVSPHEKVRDLILGVPDFAKRQTFIEKFVTLYTHPANEGQDEWWLYCNQTDIKLLPSFIPTLANAYTQGENYTEVVRQICAQRGTLSDDGEAWVDKHSGYFITYINFDEEEEYTEGGFRERTREILERDAGANVLYLKTATKDSTFDNPDARKIFNVVSALASYMGINVDAHVEFIIRSTARLQNKVMPSEEKYARSKTKGVPYETAYNSSLIMITFCYYLISVQTSIPSVKTRKRHPGCIRSFVGYPLQGEDDKSGLTYVACVADKIKSSAEPWSALTRSGKKAIAKMMVATLQRFVLGSDEVQEKIKVKLEYLKLPAHAEAIPQEHEIQNWVNFLPPLQKIKLGTIEPLSSSFGTDFLADIRKGSPRQFDKILVMRSKIIYFSLKIQQLINKAVGKKVAILTNNSNEPYLENSCCDDGTMNTLQYFIDLQPEIVTYNTRVLSLGNILLDTGRMAQAAMFLDPRNTKPVYPPLSNDFSEETIYRAFVDYCKFNTSVPLEEDLRAVCMAKPADFDIRASIEEKIELLKRNGHQYSNDSLQILMAIINRSNIVHLDLRHIAFSNIQILRDIISSLDERDGEGIPALFRTNFMALLDTFEIGGLMEDTEEMRTMNNYLAASNDQMRDSILEFVKANSSKKIHKDIVHCIEEISNFRETGTSIFIESTDETIFKMTQFIKNSMRLICKVFPNMIINKVDPCHSGCKMPKYWKLSEWHNNDLSNILDNYYSNFTSLFDNKELNYILERSYQVNRELYMLAEVTEFYAPIRLQGETYMYSIFNRQLSVLLFKYYFYSAFTNIIHVSEDVDAVLQAVGAATEGVEAPLELSPSVESVMEEEQGSTLESEIILGEKKGIDEKVAELLTVYSRVICNNKKMIDYNYEMLMEKVHRSKEKEKDTITDYLKAMSDEGKRDREYL